MFSLVFFFHIKRKRHVLLSFLFPGMTLLYFYFSTWARRVSYTCCHLLITILFLPSYEWGWSFLIPETSESSTTLGCKNLGIIKSDFVVKTHFFLNLFVEIGSKVSELNVKLTFVYTFQLYNSWAGSRIFYKMIFVLNV